LKSAFITIDEVVFEPKHLVALLGRYSLPHDFGPDCCITATGEGEVAQVLEAALSDWVDFSFVPTPKPFVVYADHDEYATFYANTKSNLNRVGEVLLRVGFDKVTGYERSL
jgi:hypothetical protein